MALADLGDRIELLYHADAVFVKAKTARNRLSIRDIRPSEPTPRHTEDA